jgi:hypothetical protein
MPLSRVYSFNKDNQRNYSPEEYARREEEAEPFLMFQALGGASASQSFLSGEVGAFWHQVYNRAVKELGVTDPSVIDDWVENQRRLAFGLDPLPTQAMIKTGTLPQPTDISFLGSTPAEPAGPDDAGSFLGGGQSE